MSWRRAAAFISSPILFFTIGFVSPNRSSAQGQSLLPVEQIVQRMQQLEAKQSKELKHYEALRHYDVQYKGLGTHLAAKMDVDLKYDIETGKSFQIVSQSGSKLLCNKVLERAVDSEQEASKDRSSTALNTTNYRFQLSGTEPVDGRPAYILNVDPLKKSKFLYRGRVWVDSDEYAVVKIDVEPARNPSFWIRGTHIVNTYVKTDGVWLPAKNRSESKIRFGGTALLEIDYGTYHVLLAGSPRVAETQVARVERREKLHNEGSSFLRPLARVSPACLLFLSCQTAVVLRRSSTSTNQSPETFLNFAGCIRRRSNIEVSRSRQHQLRTRT